MIWTYTQLVIGCFICVIGINWVAVPNGFAVTGMTGLAMTLAEVTGFHYAWMSYGIMFVVLALALWTMGFRELSNIIFLSFLYPAVLLVLSYVPVEIIFKEKLIAVAVCGICNGVGTGICYRLGYSYGGTDTVAKILKNTIMKAVPLKTILLMEDILILLIMLAVFDLDIVAYAFVGQIVFANSMNYVVFKTGPKLYEIQIICEYPEPVKRYIVDEIHKSVTIHHVVGGYSGKTKAMLDCVCTYKEYVKLREYIKEQDIHCFMKVLPMMHVFGEDKDFLKIGNNILE